MSLGRWVLVRRNRGQGLSRTRHSPLPQDTRDVGVFGRPVHGRTGLHVGRTPDLVRRGPREVHTGVPRQLGPCAGPKDTPDAEELKAGYRLVLPGRVLLSGSDERTGRPGLEVRP